MWVVALGGAFALWLAISVGIYIGVARNAIARIERDELRLLAAIGTAIPLSPGLVLSHGVFPWPGGLGILFALFAAPEQLPGLTWCWVGWVVTSVIFIVLSNKKRRQLVAEAASGSGA